MGKYTNSEFLCATKDCGHFVADHRWEDKRTDAEKKAAVPVVDEQTRGACHAIGTGCQCKDYVDSGREELGGVSAPSAASLELAALQAKIDAAKKAKLEKELADLTAGN